MNGRIPVALALSLATALVACGGGSRSDTPQSPPAPTGVSAAAGDGQVAVSWTAVSGATSYNVYWSTTTGVTKANGTKLAGVASGYVHTGRNNGTAYHYVVTAVNANGESADSAQVSATPVPPAPPAPGNVSATPGNSVVTIAWSASAGATSYNVYRATSAANATKANGTKIPGATTGYVDSVTNNVTYYYVVTAQNLGGESAESAVASAVPATNPAPAAPSGLTAVAGDAQVTLTWSAVTGATSYNLYYSTTAGVTQTTGTAITGVTSGYVHAGLTNGTTYHYVVTAANANGPSTDSAPDSATPVPPAPPAPGGLAAGAGNAQVQLTWSASAGATSYNLYWSNTSGVTKGNGTKIAGVTSGHVHSGLTNGTLYYYVVTAQNLGGESAESAQASATPQPPPPAAPANPIASAGDGQVTVSWTASANATSYNLYWSENTGVTTGSTKITGATSPYVHTGRTNGTPYYYRLTAVNSGGESSLSSEVGATPMPGLPAVPTSVTATAGAGQVTVGWASGGGTVSSYNVYWSTTSPVTSSSTKVADNSSPYVHTVPQTQGTTYYYRVSAVNLAGESALSAEVSAVPVQQTYSVSGTVAHTGAATGRIYIGVTEAGCSGCGPKWGTSIAGPGAYTIRGIHSGNFQVVAYRDTIGRGVRNGTFPSGTSSSFGVASANVTGVNVTLTDATPPAPAAPTGLVAVSGDGGGFLVWDLVQDSNGLEVVSGYEVSWGTSAAATGSGSASIVAHDNPFLLPALTNGTAYYFKVRSKVGATTSAWSASYGPFTPNPGVGGHTVSGTVTIPGTPAGGLIVALAQVRGPPIYVARITSPSTAQPYSISGVAAGTYSVYAILDQNGNGSIDSGELANVFVSGLAPVITVSGNVTQNLSLTAPDAMAIVMTNHSKQGTDESYSLDLEVGDGVRQIVAAALVSGAGVPTPVDLAREWGGFRLWESLGSLRPAVGGTYGFDVTYVDLSTARLYATVQTVLDAFPQALAVTPTPSRNVPTFTWQAPASPPSGWWGYRIEVSGGFGWWSYPRDGAMPATETSVVYGTGDSGSLATGTQYSVRLSVQDSSGNSCSTETSYTP